MIRVFLADDHRILRDGLSRLISETEGLTLAGEASKGREVLERVNSEVCDVLILDLSFEDVGGVEVLRRLRKQSPNLSVIVLSMYSEAQFAVRLMKMGALAYLSKGCSSSELVEAIRCAARGQRYVTSAVATALLTPTRGDDRPGHERLSAREFQIFMLIAEGSTPGEIAAELDLASSTVSSHLIHIRQKLDVRTNGEMIQYAYRAHLIKDSS